MKTEILYEDRDVLVAYKPAGLATQTARVGQPDMVSELKNYLQKKNAQQENSQKKRAAGKTGREHSAPYLGVIHRLDQPVEGLLVFAKNTGSAASLTAQLQKQDGTGMFHKRYYGVLCGKPARDEGELVDYLYKNKDNMAVIVEVSETDCGKEAGTPADNGQTERSGKKYESFGESRGENGPKFHGTSEIDTKKAALQYQHLQTDAKKAVLQYRILQTTDRMGVLDLADIHIITGRFHQIRAQMAHAGTPLLGDVKYGSEESKEISRKLDIRNVALCAYCLEFIHPVTGEKMCFRTEARGKAFSYFSQS